MNYSYYDSEAGKQNETFPKLSELLKYIEDFEPKGNSEGTIYEDENPILEYVSENNNLTFRAIS